MVGGAVIGSGAFVDQVGFLAEGAEAMSETGGNPEHLPVLFGQLAAEPMTKLWRADPDIDRYVEK